MYLKSLEIGGFKSFAKKTKLEFNTPISAIVGPNGSGKSNVAEAFSFVLGEQSIKSMRGKRGEDLIFNGSQTAPRANRANVRIIFDNSDRFLDIDYDEVIIKRAVHRDGVNQYFINDSAVRLKDITELLAGANIGSSGHHIISQGEADRILNVNSRERRTMIEEALGLKIYQYKRIVSEKKLQKVQENIKAVQSLRKENAPHLKFLKRQIDKLEKSFQMRKQLGDLYKDYFKREDIYLKFWKKKIEQDKNPLLKNLSELEEKLRKAKSVLGNSQKSKGESQKIIVLEKQLSDLRNQKSELTRALGRTEGMIAALKTAPAGPKKENAGKMVGLDDVRNLELKINSQIEIAENLDDISQIKGILRHIKESISQFISNNSNLGLGAPSDLLGAPSPKLKELEGEKKEIEKKIENVGIQESDILSRYNSLKTEIEKEKDSGRGAEVAMFEISARQSEVKSRLNSLENLEEKIKFADEEFKKELNEAYILAGRESVQFQNEEIKEEDGNIIGLFDIANESRDEQTDRRKKIERIKIRVEDLGGGSGEDITKEYKEAQKRDEYLVGEVEDLEKSAESLAALIQELKEKLDTEFKIGLEKIDRQFQEFFTLMFGGGKANLNLVKEKSARQKKDTDLDISDEDLIAEIENDPNSLGADGQVNNEFGIEIGISLPNKKIKGLQMLSGGERSLTSIALLFAMSQVHPPPFIILDETDAALDEANSKKYGEMVENLSKLSQLILITHNRETMSRANILYGVTMGTDGVSKLLSVHFDEAVKVAK
ncbi:MAG: AAA family ATPase [Candidatus Pacebacteria bacterium]|nr:AAA family ATPase [Candidatus Paceibacterota bacterium]